MPEQMRGTGRCVISNYGRVASVGDTPTPGWICMGIHMPFAGLVNEPQRFADIAETIGDKPLLIPPFLLPHEIDSPG